MTFVTLKNADEFEPHLFVSEASELGLRPGEWPARLETDLGNGLPFIGHSKKIDAEGDLQYVRYRQVGGCVDLKVFND